MSNTARSLFWWHGELGDPGVRVGPWLGLRKVHPWLSRSSLSDGATGSVTERDLVLTHEGVSPDIGTMKTAFLTMKTVSTTGVYLPIDLGAEKRTWQCTQIMTSSRVASDLESVGVESVRVPAGDYEAVHVKVTVRGNAGHVQNDDVFFARGVGLVKYVQSAKNGYRSERVLVRFERGTP